MPMLHVLALRLGERARAVELIIKLRNQRNGEVSAEETRQRRHDTAHCQVPARPHLSHAAAERLEPAEGVGGPMRPPPNPMACTIKAMFWIIMPCSAVTNSVTRLSSC